MNWGLFPKESRSTLRSGIGSLIPGTITLLSLLLFPSGDLPELLFQLILFGSLFAVIHGAVSIPYSRVQAGREEAEQREREERRMLGLNPDS